MNKQQNKPQAALARLQLRRIDAQIASSVAELDDAMSALSAGLRRGTRSDADAGSKSSRA